MRLSVLAKSKSCDGTIYGKDSVSILSSQSEQVQQLLVPIIFNWHFSKAEKFITMELGHLRE